VDITQKIKETILYYLVRGIGRGRDGDDGDVGGNNEYLHKELFKIYGELQL
jgi:hypothetical protein